MIEFYSETNFKLSQAKELSSWILKIIQQHNKELGELIYVFVDDAYLLNLNKQFLQHDTLTDIISFDNSLGNLISGEIYISIPRVQENACLYKQTFADELHRVMIHGVLHFIGFHDKTEEQRSQMRELENNALNQRTLL